MESLLSLGQSAVIMVVGLAVRFLVAVLILAAIVGSVVVALASWRTAVSWRGRGATGVGHTGTLEWLTCAYYAPWHTWLAPARKGTARVGLDALGARLLPQVTRVDVVSPGTELHSGDPFAHLTTGARTLTLRAPVDACVVGVNRDVQRSPQTVVREPYRHGWLVVVAPKAQTYPSLAHGEPAAEWLKKEEARLQHALECTLGFAAADGGELVAPTADLLSDEQWNTVAREFV